MITSRWQHFERDEESQAPYLTETHGEDSLFDSLRHLYNHQQIDDEDDVGWDGQKVRLEGAEACSFEL